MCHTSSICIFFSHCHVQVWKSHACWNPRKKSEKILFEKKKKGKHIVDEWNDWLSLKYSRTQFLCHVWAGLFRGGLKSNKTKRSSMPMYCQGMLDEWLTIQTLIRCHILIWSDQMWHCECLIWVYTVCSGMFVPILIRVIIVCQF